MNFLNDISVSNNVTATGTVQAANMTATSLADGSAYNSFLVESSGVFYKKAMTLGGTLLPTGTEGQTLYNNAGVWTAHSGVFWDDTNNRLGVGVTASLAAKIHTKGSGATSSTYSFKAENSSAVEGLSVRDDGLVTVNTLATPNTTLVANLNADLLDNYHLNVVGSSLRANVNVTGGGLITWNASAYLLWSTRFIVISNGNGAFFSTSGYFDITCPTSGTITGVGGAADATATAAGIPIGGWNALYYILPIGSNSSSVAANFRLVNYTAALEIPHHWVLLAVYNGDNFSLRLPNGLTLLRGQSYNTTVSTSAYPPYTGTLAADNDITAVSTLGGAITLTRTVGTLTAAIDDSLSFPNNESSITYSILGAFLNNALTNCVAQQGATLTTSVGGTAGVVITNPQNLLSPYASTQGGGSRDVCAVTTTNGGTATFTITGIVVDTPSNPYWDVFLVTRISTGMTVISNILVEIRDITSAWITAYNGSGAGKWTNYIFRAGLTNLVNYPPTGVRITLTFNAAISTWYNEIGLWNKNYMPGRGLFGVLNFNNRFTGTNTFTSLLTASASATITGAVGRSILDLTSGVVNSTANNEQALRIIGSNNNIYPIYGINRAPGLQIQNTSNTDSAYGAVSFANSAGLQAAAIAGQFTSQANTTGELVFLTRATTAGGFVESMRLDGNSKLSLNAGGIFTIGGYWNTKWVQLPAPSANAGPGFWYIRLQSASTVNIITVRIRVYGEWNWGAAFGTLEADYSYYAPGDGTIHPGTRDFRVIHKSGQAYNSLRLGDLVVENGYISIPVWSNNTNSVFANIEWSNTTTVVNPVSTTWTTGTLPALNITSIQGEVVTDHRITARGFQYPTDSLLYGDSKEYTGPYTLVGLTDTLGSAHGIGDAFRYSTILSPEKWNGTAWSADTVDYTPLVSGNQMAYVEVITAAESPTYSKKRFVVKTKGQFSRPNYFMISRRWNQGDWGYYITIESSPDNVTYTTWINRVQPDGALASFVNNDFANARYFRITIEQYATVTAGSLRFARLRGLTNEGLTFQPFTIAYDGAVTINDIDTGTGATSSSLTIAGDSTTGRQIRFGSTAGQMHSTVGTHYSSGRSYMASNAEASAALGNTWTQPYQGAANGSAILELDGLTANNALFTLRRAPALSANAAYSSFWGSPVFTVSNTGVVTAAGGFTSSGGDIVINDYALQLLGSSNGFSTYVKTYIVNTATPATLVNAAGTPLPLDKAYLLEAYVTATSSTTGAKAVIWNDSGGTRYVVKMTEMGVDSNHIEFYLDTNVPKVRVYNHTTLYAVVVRVTETASPSSVRSYGAFTGGLLYENPQLGGVGIGTYTPARKLDVRGYIQIGADSGTPDVELAGIRFKRTTYGGTNDSAAINFRRAGSGGEGQLSFATRTGDPDVAPVERLRITNLGRFGFNTTNTQVTYQFGDLYTTLGANITTPTMLLAQTVGAAGTVVDALRVDCYCDTAFDKGVAISMGYGNAGSLGEYTSRIVHYGNITNTRATKLAIQTHSVTAHTWNPGISIDNVGYVGINTTTGSSFPLEVYAAGVGVARLTTASSGTSLRFDTLYTGTGLERNWAIGSNLNAYGDFAIMQSTTQGGDPLTGSTYRLYIDNTGNVGVGPTTIENSAGWNKVFAVYGGTNARAYTGTSNVRNIMASHNSAVFSSGGTGTGVFGTETSHNVAFITGGSTRMTLDTSGRLGIATTAPSYNLHVVGTAYVSGDISTASNVNATAIYADQGYIQELYPRTYNGGVGLGIQQVSAAGQLDMGNKYRQIAEPDFRYDCLQFNPPDVVEKKASGTWTTTGAPAVTNDLFVKGPTIYNGSKTIAYNSCDGWRLTWSTAPYRQYEDLIVGHSTAGHTMNIVMEIPYSSPWYSWTQIVTSTSPGAGTWYYRISTLTTSGESFATPAIAVTLTGTQSVTINWQNMKSGTANAVTGYRVYRSSSAGAWTSVPSWDVTQTAATAISWTDPASGSTNRTPVGASTAGWREVMRSDNVSSWPGNSIISRTLSLYQHSVDGTSTAVRIAFEFNWNAAYSANSIFFYHIGLYASYPLNTTVNAPFYWDSTKQVTFPGSVSLTGATGAQLQLNGATSNYISWTSAGLNTPTYTTSSVGTKLLLYPAVTGSTADYAIGIASGTLWSSLPGSGTQFKWYAGTTNIMTLASTGALTLTGPVTGTYTHSTSLDQDGAYLTFTDATVAAPGGTTVRGVVYASFVKSGAAAFAGSSNTYCLAGISSLNAGSTPGHYNVWAKTYLNGETVTDLVDLYADVGSGNSGTVTNRYGVRVGDFGTGGTRTVGSQYGLFVNSLTSGTSVNYAIYTAGTTPSYFGGIIGVGATPIVGYRLHVAGDPGYAGGGSANINSNPSWVSGSLTSVGISYNSGFTLSASAATVPSVVAYFAQAGTIGVGVTLSEYKAFYCNSWPTGGTLTNAYGFVCDGAAGANRYGVYIASAQSYFGGLIGVSTTPTAGIKMAVEAGGAYSGGQGIGQQIVGSWAATNVTTQATVYDSLVNLSGSAATVPLVVGYNANGMSIGAGISVTNYVAFRAAAWPTGSGSVTNANIGFHCAAVAGAGNYGVYVNSAQSYFGGTVTLGTGASLISGGKIITPIGTSPGGTHHWTLATTGGVTRWGVGLINTESSGSAGSNFAVWSYDDGGTYLTTPLVITRASGLMTINNGVAVSGLTGYMYANGAGAVTASTTIPGSVITGSISSGTVPLSSITAPTANTSIACGANHLQLTFTNPVNGGLYDGAIDIDITGAFGGDALHIHQRSGAPAAAFHLIHAEASATNVVGIASLVGSTSKAFAVGDIGAETAYFLGSGQLLSVNDVDGMLYLTSVSADSSCYLYGNAGGTGKIRVQKDGKFYGLSLAVRGGTNINSGTDTFSAANTGQVTTGFVGGTINTTTPGGTQYGLHFNGQVTNDYATGITWNAAGSAANANAGIYVQGSSVYGSKMYFATTDAFGTGAKTYMSADHLGVVNFVRARPTYAGNTIVDAGNYSSIVPTVTAASFASGTVTLTRSTGGNLTASIGSYYTTPTYVQSRLQNLITNGSGLLGDNTNFTSFTFDASDTHGGGGSFKYTSNGSNATIFSDEFIPIDSNKQYELVGWAKAGDIGGANIPSPNNHYFGLAAFDIDQNAISPTTFMKYTSSTDTTLAVALNIGDSTITLTDGTGWAIAGTQTYERQILWWPYTNAKGYTYPDYTYSRNGSYGRGNFATNGCWSARTGNVLTLTQTWPGPALAAGTKVSNATSGSSYKYVAMAGNSPSNVVWTRYSGRMIGLDTLRDNSSDKFPPGTAYVKLLFLPNYGPAAAGGVVRFSDITFGDLGQRADGTATLPSYSFGNDLATGMYLYGASALGFSAGGTNVLTLRSGSASTLSSALAITSGATSPGLGITQSSSSPWSIQITRTDTSGGASTISVYNNATTNSNGQWTFGNPLNAPYLISTVASGTAPVQVTSSTLCTNLNADLLDGMHASSSNTGSTVVSRDSSGNFIAGTITAALSGNATTANSAVTVTGQAGQLLRYDNRAVAPTSNTATYFQFGFGSYANNNTAGYADYLHMRGYGDSSGGNDNLIMFAKSGIGIRMYQQTFGSSTAYSTFKSVLFSDGTYDGGAAVSGIWGISVTGNAATATTATNANNVATTDDNATATQMNLTWVSSTSGNQAVKTSSTKLQFRPSDGLLTAAGFSGPLSGSSTSCSGNSASATYASTVTVTPATGTKYLAMYNATTGNIATYVSNSLSWDTTASLLSVTHLTIGGVLTATKTGTGQVASLYSDTSSQSVSVGLVTLGRSSFDYPIAGFNFVATSTTGVYNYAASDFASAVWFSLGGVHTRHATSGTAGNPITWTTRLFVPNTGAVTIDGSAVLTASNYGSYSPSLTGSGASGSWNISVNGSSASCTGNAATATTATNVAVSAAAGTTNYLAMYTAGSGSSLATYASTNLAWDVTTNTLSTGGIISCSNLSVNNLDAQGASTASAAAYMAGWITNPTASKQRVYGITGAQVLTFAGAAAASHTHSATDITSGTLTSARGGTNNGSITSNALAYGGSGAYAWTGVNSSATKYFMSQVSSGIPTWSTIAGSDVGSGASGITGTGALTAGSIASGFGTINNGTNTLSTGAITSTGASANLNLQNQSQPSTSSWNVFNNGINGTTGEKFYISSTTGGGAVFSIDTSGNLYVTGDVSGASFKLPTSAPTAATGRAYFSGNRLYVYNGSAWVSVLLA